MNLLKTKKLNTRFFILTAFLYFIVIVVVGTAIKDSVNITNHAETLQSKGIKILNDAHKLKLAVVQVQQWLTDISATRGLDGLNDGFDEAENNAKLIRELIADLKTLDTEHSDQFDAMLPVFDNYYAAGKMMAQAYIDEGPAGGNKMMAQFDEAAANMSKQVDTFLEKTITQTNISLHLQLDLASSSRITIFIGAMLALIGISIVYFIMSRALSHLPKIVSELQNIATGDLTSHLEVTREDEIGDLMQGLRDMQNQLKIMIGHISDTTGNLTSVTSQMNSMAIHSGENIDKQQEETNLVALAMNELNTASHDVTQNITESTTATRAVRNENIKCEKTVNDAIETMQKLSSLIDDATETIDEVEKNSNEISSILDVIGGISEQTNLLALNAAIEAARAGEQGRGFAVVADEVRSLANRTQESTQQIKEMIDRLQSGSKKGVEVMRQSREFAQVAVERSTEAGVSIADISKNIILIDDTNIQVGISAEKQSSVSENVNSKIISVKDMAFQNSASVKETLQANNEITTIAGRLGELIQQFKV